MCDGGLRQLDCTGGSSFNGRSYTITEAALTKEAGIGKKPVGLQKQYIN